MPDVLRLIHEPSGRTLGHGRVARTLRGRLLGVISLELSPGAFYGIPDFWVHSLGMKAAIDAAFCDRAGCVLRVLTLAPNRLSPPVFGTKLIWETAQGGLSGVAAGDFLRCE